MSAARRWSWHRLQPQWAEHLVADAAVRPGELIVDLGAGAGALTLPLAGAGARVIAVELHAGRAARLRQRVALGQPADGAFDVVVVCGDLRTAPFPRRPFRVVANPPFAHTAALLRRITSRESAATEARLVLQRAVVRQLVADPPRGWSARVAHDLPRSAFSPRPVVDTSVVVLHRHRRR